MKIRFRINCKYSNTRVEILKITLDQNDGTVKIRWRVRGVKGYKAFLQPWKFKLWNMSQSIRNESELINLFYNYRKLSNNTVVILTETHEILFFGQI